MSYLSSYFFFFNDTATTEIYTLSLHDALPISCRPNSWARRSAAATPVTGSWTASASPPTVGILTSPRRSRNTRRRGRAPRSAEHTSELQSQSNLVCRLPLEKQQTSDNHNSSHY